MIKLTEFPLYLLGQFEELGRVLIHPVFNFFSKGYPDALYYLFIAVGASLGGGTSFVVVRYFVDKLFRQENKNKSSHKEEKLKVSLAARNILAAVFTVIFVYLLSILALVLGGALTEQSLLFLIPISVLYPPATFFLATFAFATIGVVAPIFWLGLGAKKLFPLRSELVKKISISAFIFFSLAVLLAVVTEMSWDNGGSYAHRLHALVKNTCVIDPDQVNCPQKFEDFEKLDPDFYTKVQKTHQVFYSYNPEQEEYVLLVRYSPYDAILFSQLLKSPEQNGNQANDFELVEIETFGRDQVKNIPEFAKEFEYLPEWDKR